MVVTEAPTSVGAPHGSELVSMSSEAAVVSGEWSGFTLAVAPSCATYCAMAGEPPLARGQGSRPSCGAGVVGLSS